MSEAADLITMLAERGLTVASCESLTGGLVTAALTAVPGSSAVVRGGFITYATDLKTSLAQVSPQLIERDTVVSESVAIEMARGVRTTCGADLGLACTGVAGPGAHGGVEAGTVCVALVASRTHRSARLRLSGDRDRVRQLTVAALFTLLGDYLKS